MMINKRMYRELNRGMGILFFIVAVIVTPFACNQGGGNLFGENILPSFRANLSDDELYLYNLMMNYRHQNGLASIPVSSNLSCVARIHARDLELHPPAKPCSMHSWSRYGSWKPFCDTGGGSGKFMWTKPAELTGYSGKGYEIAAWTSDRIDPGTALSLWIGSSAHNAVIINAGTWNRSRWSAVGLAISDHYALVWFGTEPDIVSKSPYY